MKKRKSKFLLIDDDNNYLLLLKHALEKNNQWYNLTVLTANHVGQISKNELQEVDMAVVDLFMPDCDGITSSLIIRSHVKIPIMILTANPEDKRLKQFEELLEPILPLEKSDNFSGTSHTIFNYYKMAKDFIGLKKKINDQDVNNYAVGFVMAQNQCDEKTAINMIKKISRDQRVSFNHTATDILSEKISLAKPS